jgi:ribosome biogenesis GTPase
LRSSRDASATSLLISGEIIAAFGRHFLVDTESGSAISCVLRGKKGGAACGDRVEIRPTAPGQGVIENILPRITLLYRSDISREKLIAANVTQMIIVVAAVPSFSEELITRCLVAAENQHLDTLIVLNKTDLSEPTRVAFDTLSLYQKLNYILLPLSARNDVGPLLPHLHGKTSILVGQSGMGKSTMINSLVPTAERITAEISVTLDSGRHATTHARLYHLDPKSRIIDSPGVQQFGLRHLTDEDIAWGFREFHPYLGKCRFSNCNHIGEPDCAIAQAAHDKKIEAQRLGFYRRLLSSRDRSTPPISTLSQNH